jgi:hypothetical protein
MPSARVRFAFEAGFLVLVAAGAALAELRPRAIIILMAGAWLLVALIERASSHETPRAVADVSMPAPEPALDEAPKAYRWLFWRRERAHVEELVSPTAALEERPSRSHVRRIEPEQQPEPVTVVVEPEAPPEPAPGPAVTTRPLDLPGLEEAPVPSAPEPPPARPRFAALRPRQPAAPEEPSPPPVPPAREWNIWDLERLAREQAGDGPRDEEWSALFTHLRAFANAAGVLPKEFDGLVRESFGELIEVAA